MTFFLNRFSLLFLLVAGIGACGDSDNKGITITGPELEEGPGRVYPLKEVNFAANDGVPVSALVGPLGKSEKRPVVILLHDLGSIKETWLSTTGLMVQLLERGYMTVAIDMRGHGDTPLPENRQVLLLEDLENGFIDVAAALTWLRTQPGADVGRVALIGTGSGGNVAYVSKGVFPQQIRTAVSLSPGLWERNSLQPLVVGAGLQPFGPSSILFIVGGRDVLTGPNVALSYADFARNLAAATAEPKSLLVFQNSEDHGVELLNNIREARESLFLWLENNL